MNPEVYSYLFSKIFEEGALDFYITNITMKKNRPGNKLSILCIEKDSGKFEELLFRETTTLGIRKYKVDRISLEREFKKVKTKYGEVTIKIAYKDGNVLKYSPEYEDCKNLAINNDVPIMEVYKEAIGAVSVL